MVLPRRPRYSARHAIGLSRLDRADPPLIIVSSPACKRASKEDGGTEGPDDDHEVKLRRGAQKPSSHSMPFPGPRRPPSLPILARSLPGSRRTHRVRVRCSFHHPPAHTRASEVQCSAREVVLGGGEGKWGVHVQSPLSFAVVLLEMGSWRVLGETGRGRLAIKISSVKFGLGVNDCAVHLHWKSRCSPPILGRRDGGLNCLLHERSISAPRRR